MPRNLLSQMPKGPGALFAMTATEEILSRPVNGGASLEHVHSVISVSPANVPDGKALILE